MKHFQYILLVSMERKDGGEMRKIIQSSLVMVLILTFSGCVNLYNGRRPADYGPAIWISKNPDIWFEVPIIQDQNDRKESFAGQISFNDQTIQINVAFNYGNTVFFFKSTSDGGMLLNGRCDFGSEKMIVKIDKKSDNLFGGFYDQIVFIRSSH